ncbi:hypothetical protein AYO22_11681 [Fonsecaea multimorphosa]|nr:hypothetical protein AYO22_11681 [Fonsecaea multimorphosa]
MTVALRGIVSVFRKANRASVRVYAHYPEVNGEETLYYRHKIKEFAFGEEGGKHKWPSYKWTSYPFTLNVCQIFAPALLKRLAAVIDELPDPLTPTPEPAHIDSLDVQSSQDDSSALESQDEGFRKPRQGGLLEVTRLRIMIWNQQQHLEQERKDAKDREMMLVAQLEQQRKDS